MSNILLWVGVGLVAVLVVVLALAVKLTVLASLAAVVFRRMDSDHAAVSGRWRLRTGESDDARCPPTDGATEAGVTRSTRVTKALREFVERDVSWLTIESRHSSVRVVSSDATAVNYATGGSRIERRLSDEIEVQATADWRGDVLHVELSTSCDARVEEKYTASEDRGCLEVEVQLIVPDAGLHLELTRTYDRIEDGGPF